MNNPLSMPPCGAGRAGGWAVATACQTIGAQARIDIARRRWRLTVAAARFLPQFVSNCGIAGKLKRFL
ncbi:TPA: hypothetical protein SMG08_000080 [Serratia marcescens]|uniref:hypothetical protein n=1 Tax=Serratia marcescens TaxID=615 RepID=UPI0021BDA750|nr:hypothetical protein [Serratia marcescens]HEJ7268522.1 hypothetical protein [Serratia marcescens]